MLAKVTSPIVMFLSAHFTSPLFCCLPLGVSVYSFVRSYPQTYSGSKVRWGVMKAIKNQGLFGAILLEFRTPGIGCLRNLLGPARAPNRLHKQP